MHVPCSRAHLELSLEKVKLHNDMAEAWAGASSSCEEYVLYLRVWVMNIANPRSYDMHPGIG